MIPYRYIHFIGILSPEMASLANFTVLQGVHVSGSDNKEVSVYIEPLLKAGVKLFDMFAQTNIGPPMDLVVVSPYYDVKHPEAMVAEQHNIKVVTATEFIKDITKDYRKLIVLDEYQGPVITQYLTHILANGHQPINALLNVPAVDLENNAMAISADSEWFALPLSGFKRDMNTYEANFLAYSPEVVIIPSVQYNYPEINTTLDDVYQSYYQFVRSIPRKGLILGNSDWSRMKRLRTHLADRHFETYGFDTDATWRIRDLDTTENHTTFRLTKSNQSYGTFSIPVTGESMVYAAVSVIIMCLLLEVKLEVIQRGLENLPKLKRYFETSYDKQGRLIIDDCADHPDTIAAVLENIRTLYPTKKIWCLYQPGSYLRTKSLAPEFQKTLSIADNVYLADIKGYPKEKSEGLHIRHFIAEMKQAHSQTFYIDPSTNMTQLLQDRVALGDCIVTLGIDGVCHEIIAPLRSDDHGSTS